MRTDAPQPSLRRSPLMRNCFGWMRPRPSWCGPMAITGRQRGSRQEFGPFASVEMALADMAEADGEAPEPGETLQEAEDEIGIADWIDPDTGDPAEGFLRPRLEAD
jgi:hypothetical protein